MMIKGLVTVKYDGKVVMKVFCSSSGEAAQIIGNKLFEHWPVNPQSAYFAAIYANFGETRCLRVQTEDEIIYNGDLERDDELDTRIRGTFQEEKTNPLGDTKPEDRVIVIDVTCKKEQIAARQRKEKEKADALKLITKRPDSFQWLFRGTLYGKTQLLQEVNNETETGNLIILAAREVNTEPTTEGSFMLGKRAICLKCGTEIMITKAGKGLMVCCQQNMDIKGAKPIPSSD